MNNKEINMNHVDKYCFIFIWNGSI